MDHRNIIVIGSSAGGLQALDLLFAQLSKTIPASVFLVQHMAPESKPVSLLHHLADVKGFTCKIPGDHESFRAGTIYIAPSDHHLLLKDGHMLVTRGAAENRYRPSIDTLFRSAAISHGVRVIGVLLTGMLDDGTSGLTAIKKCGGVTVVQDPKSAAYPDMPQNALNNLTVDYSVPIYEMGQLLESLVIEKPPKQPPVPKDLKIEAEIAERMLSSVGETTRLGPYTPYTCPDCGGVLTEVGVDEPHRLRCHTGHSFTESALIASQGERIEETLWTAMRMFEERKNLLNGTALKITNAPNLQRSYREKAKEAQKHIERIKEMLTAKPLQLEAAKKKKRAA